jgi:hypothetical protein
MPNKRSRLLLTVLGGSSGYTYYVNSVSGNDSNPGTSPATAKATLGAVPALTAGQSVGLARGSTFRSQKFATITANNVTIGAYGTGARPIIVSRAVLSAGGWSKTGGLTNVYERAITFDADASGVIMTFEDSAFMTRRASTALVDANAGSYYASSDTAGSGTLYIHATGSGNPASNGKAYEFTDTTLVVNSFDATGTVLRDLNFYSSIYQNGPVYLGKNSQVYGCDFNQGSRHNFIARGGVYMEDCALVAGYNFGTGATLFVCFEATATAADTFHLVRVTVSNVGGVGLVNGFINHDSGAGAFGPCTMDHCTTISCETGYDLNYSSLYTVTDCTATNCTNGVSCGGATVYAISGLTVTGGTYGVLNSVSGATIAITNPQITILIAGGGSCIFVAAASSITLTGGLLTCDTKNNTASRGIFTTGTGVSTWVISGTRFNLRRPVYITTANPVITSMDNNAYGVDALIWTYNGTSSVGLTDWRTFSGFDANSTQDP